MLLTASQHAYDPAEQDDGHGHAYEAGGHPLEVCKSTRATAFHAGHISPHEFIRFQIKGRKKKTCWQLTERVPLILPDSLGEVDWQISGKR